MKEITRYLESDIVNDLAKKMVFLAGPRQSGKTFLAKKLLSNLTPDNSATYLNWDAAEDREIILSERFPAGRGMIVLDEIHKFDKYGIRSMPAALFLANLV